MRKGIITFSIIVSLLAFFGGCSKFKVNSFVAPIWDTQFSAPLFDRTYTLGEILYKDSTYLYTTPPSNVFSIFTSQDIAGIPVAGNLEIASVPALNASQVLGNFTINSPDSIHYGILNKLPANTNGPVPQFQTDTVISPRDAFSNYKSATISNGILQVVIHNGYPAPIYFENGSIYLLDANNNPLSIPIDTIQVNSTAVADLPLRGDNSRRILKYRLHMVRRVCHFLKLQHTGMILYLRSLWHLASWRYLLRTPLYHLKSRLH